MKFSVDFDNIIAGIIVRDKLGVILITFSTNQLAWQAELENRICKRVLESFNRSQDRSQACFKNDAAQPHCCGHSRLRFVPSMPHGDFLELLQGASVMLDPFPFGGGVTSLEALAVGTPVVTFPVSFLIVF
jgi:glycosyltransferase involved in cell wall biosynthesis